MSLLSIKINFFKTIKILNIFQYILTRLINNKQQNSIKQTFFFFKFGINLIVMIFSWAKKTVLMYLNK